MKNERKSQSPLTFLSREGEEADGQHAIRPLAAVPTLLTLGNGIFGFAAIVSLAKAYAFLQIETENSIAQAGSLIFSAAIYVAISMGCDVLDGWAARRTGTDSRFGAILDSLCDAISFGVAPALMIRVFGEALYGVGLHATPDIKVRILWGVSAAYMACAVLRLARFTADTSDNDDHKGFVGLPMPAAGAGIVCLFLLCWDPAVKAFRGQEFMIWILPIAAISLSLLMVSKVRYIHVFNHILGNLRSISHVAVGFIAIVAIWVFGAEFGELVVFTFPVLLYIVAGPVIALLRGMRSREAPEQETS